MHPILHSVTLSRRGSIGLNVRKYSKCANVLIDENGNVNLSDVGLAKVLASPLNQLASDSLSVSHIGEYKVWPSGRYKEPRCTVLGMLIGEIPYVQFDWAFFKIARGHPPPLPNSLSENACDFISVCLQVNPDDRPTAAQLLDHPFVRKPLLTSSEC